MAIFANCVSMYSNIYILRNVDYAITNEGYKFFDGHGSELFPRSCHKRMNIFCKNASRFIKPNNVSINFIMNKNISWTLSSDYYYNSFYNLYVYNYIPQGIE